MRQSHLGREHAGAADFFDNSDGLLLRLKGVYALNLPLRQRTNREAGFGPRAGRLRGREVLAALVLRQALDQFCIHDDDLRATSHVH